MRNPGRSDAGDARSDRNDARPSAEAGDVGVPADGDAAFAHDPEPTPDGDAQPTSSSPADTSGADAADAVGSEPTAVEPTAVGPPRRAHRPRSRGARPSPPRTSIPPHLDPADGPDAAAEGDDLSDDLTDDDSPEVPDFPGDDLLFDPLLSDEPIDLAAVRADDALIDALGGGGDLDCALDLIDADDPLIAMLAAWAASTRPDEEPEPDRPRPPLRLVGAAEEPDATEPDGTQPAAMAGATAGAPDDVAEAAPTAGPALVVADGHVADEAPALVAVAADRPIPRPAEHATPEHRDARDRDARDRRRRPRDRHGRRHPRRGPASRPAACPGRPRLCLPHAAQAYRPGSPAARCAAAPRGRGRGRRPARPVRGGRRRGDGAARRAELRDDPRVLLRAGQVAGGRRGRRGRVGAREGLHRAAAAGARRPGAGRRREPAPGRAGRGGAHPAGGPAAGAGRRRRPDAPCAA